MLSWNSQGIIPPFMGNPVHEPRSPYKISLCEFYKCFATVSPERKILLDGLISFRAELHRRGIGKGFQWIGGSFLENIEQLENRSPNDIDSVIFVEEYNKENQNQLQDFLGDRELKNKFKVDSYIIWPGMVVAQQIRVAVYWYGVWSHRRDGQWKGFVEIDLDPSQDQDLQRYLSGGAI